MQSIGHAPIQGVAKDMALNYGAAPGRVLSATAPPLHAKPLNLFDMPLDYGAAPGPAKSPTAPPLRAKRLNLFTLVLTLVLPFAVFTAMCWTLAFNIRYEHPQYVALMVLFGACVVLVCAFTAYKARRQGLSIHSNRDATWATLLFWTTLLCWIVGLAAGDFIYRHDMRTYYGLVSTNSYAAVDVSKAHGRQMMDAGIVTFAQGTQLDRSRTGFYKKGSVYCVAPIVPPAAALRQANDTKPLRLAYYDFWAVGVDCCGETNGFACGAYKDPYAHAGLRLVFQDSEANLFKQALQHAVTNFGINTDYPLFFEWTQDPAGMGAALEDHAIKLFYFMTLFVFGLQLFLIIVSLAAVLRSTEK
mmetsp:Transcript_108231/g.305009  ORF Transcript_108231/g.305009 Transcript_108231/m.305009 type:complete len:359 (+) Transcript_108231:121-1197(+)